MDMKKYYHNRKNISINKKRGETMAKKKLEIRAHPDMQLIGTPHPERGIAYLLEGLIKKETGADVKVTYIGDKKVG